MRSTTLKAGTITYPGGSDRIQIFYGGFVHREKITSKQTDNELNFTLFNQSSRCSQLDPSYVLAKPVDLSRDFLTIDEIETSHFKKLLTVQLRHELTKFREAEAIRLKQDLFLQQLHKRDLALIEAFNRLYSNASRAQESYRKAYVASGKSREKVAKLFFSRMSKAERANAKMASESLVKELQQLHVLEHTAKIEKLRFLKNQVYLRKRERSRIDKFAAKEAKKAERTLFVKARFEVAKLRMEAKAKDRAQLLIAQYAHYQEQCLLMDLSPLSSSAWIAAGKPNPGSWPRFKEVKQDGKTIVLKRVFPNSPSAYNFQKQYQQSKADFPFYLKPVISLQMLKLPLESQVDLLRNKNLLKLYKSSSNGMHLNDATLGLNLALWKKTRDIVLRIEAAILNIQKWKKVIIAGEISGIVSRQFFAGVIVNEASMLLCWKFAVIPLLKLVADLQAVCRDAPIYDMDYPDVTFKARSSDQSFSYDSITATIQNSNHFGVDTAILNQSASSTTAFTDETEIRVQTTIRCKLKSAQNALLSQIGLLTPATILWQVCPFSFVIDWMHEVYKFLQIYEFTAYRLSFDFIDGSQSVSTKIEKESITEWHNSYAWTQHPFGEVISSVSVFSGDWFLCQSSGTSQAKTSVTTQDRKVFYDFPVFETIVAKNTWTASKVLSCILILTTFIDVRSKNPAHTWKQMAKLIAGVGAVDLAFEVNNRLNNRVDRTYRPILSPPGRRNDEF